MDNSQLGLGLGADAATLTVAQQAATTSSSNGSSSSVTISTTATATTTAATTNNSREVREVWSFILRHFSFSPFFVLILVVFFLPS
jgi:hypothetical protein